MVKEYSCGAVLFTNDGNERKYVLVLEPNGAYGFPKGHVENDESNLETAAREIKEETGIEATFLPGMKRTIRYKINSGVEKEVTLYVAKYMNQDLNPLDDDILAVKSYPLDAALSLLKFPELRNILIETDYMLELKGE